MARERWGTFSVIDHKNAASLVPEVLLYDRLVLPVPPDDQERRRWQSKGWAPEVLDLRLEQLGDLAIRASWDLELQKDFRQRMKQLKETQFDATQMSKEAQESLHYQMTRMILAQTQSRVLPRDVTSVVTVAAYQSAHDFNTHFVLDKASADSDRATLGFLLAHKFAVPDDRDPEKALGKAIDLSNDEEFREHRRKLYAWQDDVIGQGIPPQRAIQEMEEMVAKYNQCVERAVKTVYYKFAFAVAAAGLALAAAPLGAPLAGVAAMCSLVQFATLDRKPVVDAGESAPAALFHDVKKLGIWPS
jgi:hypothetical protein